MPLTAGTRLGPYEILAPIGAGGTCFVKRPGYTDRSCRHWRIEENKPLLLQPES